MASRVSRLSRTRHKFEAGEAPFARTELRDFFERSPDLRQHNPFNSDRSTFLADRLGRNREVAELPDFMISKR
jgi:hypothetical protein